MVLSHVHPEINSDPCDEVIMPCNFPQRSGERQVWYELPNKGLFTERFKPC